LRFGQKSSSKKPAIVPFLLIKFKVKKLNFINMNLKYIDQLLL
jgi:hypothetical protein